MLRPEAQEETAETIDKLRAARLRHFQPDRVHPLTEGEALSMRTWPLLLAATNLTVLHCPLSMSRIVFSLNVLSFALVRRRAVRFQA